MNIHTYNFTWDEVKELRKGPPETYRDALLRWTRHNFPIDLCSYDVSVEVLGETWQVKVIER